MKTSNSNTRFAYDDHTSIPFKLVHLKPALHGEVEHAHRHNCFQIFFFVEGGGKHLIDFDEKNCTANSIHIVNPGNLHRLNRSTTTRGYVLLFSRDFFDKQQPNFELFLYRNDFAPFLEMKAMDFQKICQVLEEIDQEWQHKSVLSGDAIRALLRLIVIQIQRKIVFNEQVNAASDDILFQFKKLVEYGFNEKHQVQHYADTLHISADKLNQLSKNQIGKTAGSVIQERILLEAKRLLFYSNLSSKEIAFELGYEDPSYFNRVFKKQTKMTPKEFKESIREKYH